MRTLPAAILLAVAALCVGAVNVAADDFTLLPNLPEQPRPVELLPGNASGSEAFYDGTLRVYMVEPVSRWKDQQGSDFQFGFLDFALVTDVTLNDTTTWTQTVSWSAQHSGYGNVSAENIMAMAVLFSSEGEMKDAWPPYGYYFTAYPADAAAAATPGVPGENTQTPGFTHTVFVEEGTLTT